MKPELCMFEKLFAWWKERAINNFYHYNSSITISQLPPHNSFPK